MLRFSGVGLAATLLAGTALAQTGPQVDLTGLGGILIRQYENNYTYVEGAGAGRARINLPFGGLMNLELEANADVVFYDGGYSQVSTTMAAHLYARQPGRFAAGVVGVYFYTGNDSINLGGGGAEAQVQLGRVILTGQGLAIAGRWADCDSCGILLVEGRGVANVLLGPHASVAFDGALTRYSYYDDPFRVLSAGMTTTYQLGNSALAIVGQARFDRFVAVDDGHLVNNEYTALAGFRFLLGGPPTLEENATMGPGFDVWLPIPRHSCFIGDTEILMADGTRRRIDEVRVGDWVVGAGGDYNRVVEIEAPLLGDRKLHAFGAGRAFVTAEHPFMTRDGWKSIDPAATLEETRAVQVGMLTAADELVTLAAVVAEARPMRVAGGAGALAPIIDVSIETVFTPIGSITAHEAAATMRVFNLRLDGNNTYFADGYLVHNK